MSDLDHCAQCGAPVEWAQMPGGEIMPASRYFRHPREQYSRAKVTAVFCSALCSCEHQHSEDIGRGIAA